MFASSYAIVIAHILMLLQEFYDLYNYKHLFCFKASLKMIESKWHVKPNLSSFYKNAFQYCDQMEKYQMCLGVKTFDYG